ncbi:hypothetical protein D3C81_1481770 [compost metagenome]
MVDHGRRRHRRGEQRRGRARAAQLQVRRRLHAISHYQERRLQQDQLAHLALADIVVQPLVVGDLGLAEHLDAVGVDQVQVANQVRGRGRFAGEFHVEGAVRTFQPGHPREFEVGCVVVEDGLGGDAGEFHAGMTCGAVCQALRLSGLCRPVQDDR